ncbi:hypothetical protein [Ensifer aridi]|uniref:hypothetical protein n=1 Tax=Ensifer aridi TaxID=1708715 RepID=UPI000420EAA1|nr:hypothetical protein [Ensifer aridi]
MKTATQELPDLDPRLVAFVKALARHQARLDAQGPKPANENNHGEERPKRKR